MTALLTVPAFSAVNKSQKRSYVFGESDQEGERLALEHTLFKPRFQHYLELALNKHHLVQQWREQADQEDGKKLPGLRILDAGCGEGLYLHDAAAVLEKINPELESVSHFTGLDFNEAAIEAARKLAWESSPPRPYFHFCTADLTSPLEESCALRRSPGQSYHPQFEVIYVLSVLELLPQAWQHLSRLYRHHLAPGGVIYVRSPVMAQGEQGWLSPHPMFEKFSQILTHFISNINYGIDVASGVTEWLTELGAEEIEVGLQRMVMGGNTAEGLQLLRCILLSAQAFAPDLIEYGLLSQECYERLYQAALREFGPGMKGQVSYKDIIARKPLSDHRS